LPPNLFPKAELQGSAFFNLKYCLNYVTTS
jgi:hypothetical protein